MSSDQEMQFADPAWQPQTTQDSHVEQHIPAPRPIVFSQPAEADELPALDEEDLASSYAEGYRGQTPPPGRSHTIQPPQPSLRAAQSPFFNLPVWAWWVVAIIAFLFSLQFFFSPHGVLGIILVAAIVLSAWLLLSKRVVLNLQGEMLAPETHTFAVQANPKVVITNLAGNIRLHSGQDDQVEITASKRGYIFNARLNRDSQVWFNHDRGANKVTARVDTWAFFGHNTLDFDIVVPRQTNLEVTTNAGTILVQNVNGEMKLETKAGTITGEELRLQGSSRLTTSTGTISFAGALDPQGKYNFSTNIGTITAQLPSTASFDLNAKTDVGTVTNNFILGQPRRDKATGKIGVGPAYPQFKLKTDLGTITIDQL